MPRVKRGMHHAKRRRGLLKRVKGFEGGRKSLMKVAKVADLKAGSYALRDRRVKKRDSRALWQVKINAAVRAFDLSYSQFMGLLKKNNIELDRKILSNLAANHSVIFEAIVKAVK
ncbi:MAG: 50S ribosomal protein L20 [Patescibacteria group bacterium]